MRKLIITIFAVIVGQTAFSQNKQIENDTSREFSYAYISVSGKLFSKKLNVIVDLGDSPDQIMAGQEFSEVLNNKKSYAAILNYMVENEFDLVETLTLVEGSTYSGTGGSATSGVIFIMKKKKKTLVE